MTTVPDYVFNIRSRGNADLFQARGAFAYNDLLLRTSLDKNRAVNAGKVFPLFFPLFHYHRGYVRDLLLRGLQDFLPDDFGNHRTHRLIGKIILTKDRLTLRQMFDHLMRQNLNYIST